MARKLFKIQQPLSYRGFHVTWRHSHISWHYDGASEEERNPLSGPGTDDPDGELSWVPVAVSETAPQGWEYSTRERHLFVDKRERRFAPAIAPQDVATGELPASTEGALNRPAVILKRESFGV